MLIKLQSQLEGKIASFGEARELFCSNGYAFGGNWDYHCGCFDSVLHRDLDLGETVYLRVPFCVVDGELDNSNAQIQFETPYIIKHIVNVGLDKEGTSLLGSTVNQFQQPIDKDGYIHDKQYWEQVGEQSIQQVLSQLY